MKSIIIYIILLILSLVMLWYSTIVWVFTVATKKVGDDSIKYQDVLITVLVFSIIGLLGFSLYKLVKGLFSFFKK